MAPPLGGRDCTNTSFRQVFSFPSSQTVPLFPIITFFRLPLNLSPGCSQMWHVISKSLRISAETLVSDRGADTSLLLGWLEVLPKNTFTWSLKPIRWLQFPEFSQELEAETLYGCEDNLRLPYFHT